MHSRGLDRSDYSSIISAVQGHGDLVLLPCYVPCLVIRREFCRCQQLHFVVR